MPNRIPVRERFWRNVEARGRHDCWPWQGFVGTNGYGVICDRKQPIPAHRLAWSIANGREIPPGLVVRHKCDNPVCVNPAHLLLGTQRDNVNDMISRGRGANQRKTQCPRGHAYTPDNTHLDKLGIRHCRACGRERARERHMAKASA